MSVKEAYHVAINYLSRRDHARAELAVKLSERGYAHADIDEALVKLTEEKYLDDARFAGNFVRYRMQQGKGPVLIRAQLCELGVDTVLIDAALKAEEAEWLAQASLLRQQKFGTEIPHDFKLKAKQMRFLQSRGFSFDHIKHILKSE